MIQYMSADSLDDEHLVELASRVTPGPSRYESKNPSQPLT